MGMTELTEVDGISENFADNFMEAGYYSAEDVADATTDELTEVERVGESRAENVLEAAQEVADEDGSGGAEDDSETDFDLTDPEDSEDEEEPETTTEDSEDDAEPEPDTEDDEFENGDELTELSYEFDDKRDYEWFKYTLQHGVIDGRARPDIESAFEKVLESEDGSNSVDVELTDNESNAVLRHLSASKRDFMNKRETRVMNVIADVIDEL